MDEIAAHIRLQRESLLRRLSAALEPLMAALGLAWLVLTAVELTRGLPLFLQRTSMVLWLLFVLDFALRFWLAPRKRRFLRTNLLTLVSLALPALRIARFARLARWARLGRVARGTRGVRLLRVLTSLNRGMRSLGAALGRRGFGYVLLLTLLVLFAGAAGMYALESGASGGFDDYGSALWWTAMVLVTMGSEAWPRTPEGRLLCLALAVYGYTIFGYITATLASWFIATDRQERETAPSRQPK